MFIHNDRIISLLEKLNSYCCSFSFLIRDNNHRKTLLALMEIQAVTVLFYVFHKGKQIKYEIYPYNHAIIGIKPLIQFRGNVSNPVDDSFRLQNFFLILCGNVALQTQT